jgi:hypothetical protein
MHFDNNSSIGENLTRVYDFSGMGNNGTVNGGAVWNSSGKYGGAFEFDGENDWISAGTSKLGINTTNEFTVSAWINVRGDGPSSYDTIFGRSSYVRPLLIDWYQSSNRLRFGVRNSTNVYYSNTPTGSVTANSQWQHFVLTRNNTGSVRGYLNGSLVLSTSVTGNLYVPSGETNAIASTSTSGWFNGSIDELAIWNRALDSSEVSSVFSGPVSC